MRHYRREGTDRKLRSRFAAVRVRPAHRDYERAEPYTEEWLLIEWPRSETEPTGKLQSFCKMFWAMLILFTFR